MGRLEKKYFSTNLFIRVSLVSLPNEKFPDLFSQTVLIKAYLRPWAKGTLDYFFLHLILFLESIDTKQFLEGAFSLKSLQVAGFEPVVSRR